MWEIVLPYLDLAAYCAAIQQGRYIHDLCYTIPHPNKYYYMDSDKPLPRLARSWARVWPTSLVIDAMKYRGSFSSPGLTLLNNRHHHWSNFYWNLFLYSKVVYLMPDVECWQNHINNIAALMNHRTITRIWFKKWHESEFSRLDDLVVRLRRIFDSNYVYKRVKLRIFDIGYMPVKGLGEYLRWQWSKDDFGLRGNLQLEVWVDNKPVFAGYNQYAGHPVPDPDLSKFPYTYVYHEPATDDEEESGMYSNTESDEENPI